jgi:hypothetical protein
MVPKQSWQRRYCNNRGDARAATAMLATVPGQRL